jgi:hypothetical protein
MEILAVDVKVEDIKKAVKVEDIKNTEQKEVVVKIKIYLLNFIIIFKLI